MKIKFSDIDLMLDVISDYFFHFDREDNEEWYDKVAGLRDRLDDIWEVQNKKIKKQKNKKKEVE